MKFREIMSKKYVGIPLFVLLALALSGTAFAATIAVTTFQANSTVSEALSLTGISPASSGVSVSGSTVTVTAMPNEDKIVQADVANTANAQNRAELAETEATNTGVVYDVLFSTDSGATYNPAISANQLVAPSGTVTFLVKYHIHSDSPTGTFSTDFAVNRVAV
jgi:hypothetical protein